MRKNSEGKIDMSKESRVDIAIGRSRREVRWENVRLSWEELVDRLSCTKRTGESFEEYGKMEKAKQDEIKDVGGFVGGWLREGKRQKGQVLYRSVLCLDIDFGTGDLWERVRACWAWECCLYSTHKHCQGAPRYRLVLPLSRVVSEEEYEPLARKVASQLEMEWFDETTYEATRLMYWPSTSYDGEFVFRHQEGPWLDVEQVLASYEDWREVRSWPRSIRESESIYRGTGELGDPCEKSGVIGAFCRAYPLEEAIALFLGDVYEKCEGTLENRYTYLLGTTVGGAIVYEGMYLYSHHGSDPAKGRCCNAFDLVRIHKFGALDEGIEEEVKMSERPSYLAMCEWVRKDTRVQEVRESEVYKLFDAEPLIEREKEAINYLFVTPKGKTIVNTSLLAKHIRQQCSYIVVRKQGFDSEFLYWYEKGHYQLVSPNEFKGKIKVFIPEEIRKPSQWEDVYRELLTDSTTIEFEDLDSCQEIINVRNGLYNVRTGTLESHTDQIHSTIQLACSYQPDASRPETWLGFIDTLTDGDQDMAAILQEWFGLTLSNIPGYMTKKCLGLAGAVGNTGKTQYNNMLAHMIGKQSICATPLQDYEKNFGLGTVYGAKAILIDDQSAESINDSSNFKKLTGGGLIDCEIKGKQSFAYTFRGTITFGCNDLPYFKGDKGDHLFERFMIIPCDNVIPPEKRRGDILEEFKKETEGIFLWAMEGLHRLISNGYKFTYSQRAHEALEEYKSTNDSLYRYLKEQYKITAKETDRVLKRQFEEEYSIWARENDIEPIKKKNVPLRAVKHGIQLKKSSNFYYVGLCKQNNIPNNI